MRYVPALVGVKPGGPDPNPGGPVDGVDDDPNPGGGALDGVVVATGVEEVGPNKSWARKSSKRLSYFESSTNES